MRNISIDEDPSGLDRDIGQEIDIALGIEEWTHLEVECIARFFRVRDIFDTLSGQVATSFILKVDYNF